jgi:hypothetical protein
MFPRGGRFAPPREDGFPDSLRIFDPEGLVAAPLSGSDFTRM